MIMDTAPVNGFFYASQRLVGVPGGDKRPETECQSESGLWSGVIADIVLRKFMFGKKSKQELSYW